MKLSRGHAGVLECWKGKTRVGYDHNTLYTLNTLYILKFGSIFRTPLLFNVDI